MEADADRPQQIHPCCNAKNGSRGCTPVTHLPMYQTIDGKVETSRRIEYDPTVDLNVGRWLSTRVNLSQLGSDSSKSAPAASSASAPPAAAAPTVPEVKATSAIPQPLENLGNPVQRTGDEIMVCGQLYHTGTPVILWGDVGGYDHYRVERRYVPFAEADWATTQKEDPAFTTPNRFGLRADGLTPEQLEKVRGGQWDLPTLSQQMKQFVLHYDEAGLSQQCFRILQDERDLSIHFMCDLDGTIYQALDLKERAWQATTSNTISVGCEIANIGAYDPATTPNPFAAWYTKNAMGNTTITIPAEYGSGGIATPGFVGSPARPNPITGIIQGQNLMQYDYTPQQYAALTKLIATFCSIFPAVPLSYPRDASGNLIPAKLPNPSAYAGILGHYHIQTNKIDPGPAFQWDVVIGGAQEIVRKAKAVKAAVKEAAAHDKQNQLIIAAPAKAATATATAGGDSNLLRKMERKLLAAAEDAGARSLGDAPFYLVDHLWWSDLQSWLAASDDSIARPQPVTNKRLLDADERTPRAGLTLGQHYKAVHRAVWNELVDLYGPATPIVRQCADIYAGVAMPKLPASASLSPPAYTSSTSASSSSSSSSSSAFVVPEVGLRGEDEPWIMVAKRVTNEGAPGGAN